MKIPIIKISSNKIYAGMHWTRRAKIKNDYKILLHNHLLKIKPIKEKVDLHFTFYFKKYALDSSNTFFMAKMIEDCLVDEVILEDDTIEFVGRVSTESKKTKEKEDYCELQFDSTVSK